MSSYTAGPTYNAQDPFLELQLDEVYVYPSTNSSVVNWVLNLHKPSNVASSVAKNWFVIIDGQKISNSSIINGSGVQQLGYGSKEIEHGSDGKKTIAFTFEIDLSSINWIGYGYLKELKGIGTFKLKDIPVKHTITYNANGGENAPEQQIKSYGQDLTLSTQLPTRESFNFVKWNTNSQGTGDSYSPGGTYKKESDATLYAIWSEHSTYTITFDGNGGIIYVPGSSGEDVGDYYDKYDVTCDIGTSFTIPNYIVTKSQGQTDLTDPGTGEDTGTSTDPEEPFERFQGWATNKESTVVEYHSGDSVSFDSDTTLYAVYSPDKYTVTFYDGYSKDTEFGKVLKIYNDVVYGSSVNPPQEPKRNGYVFQGWSSESYKNVTANLNIQAFWDFAPIWIRSQNKWVRYDPKE